MNRFESSSFFKQKRTAEHLVEESRTDLDFLLFLLLAVFITTVGLLTDNVIVIVGAMLVAPILFPILALGLGVVTSSNSAIWRALRIIAESVVLSVVVATVTALLIDVSGFTEQMEILTNPDLLLYFLISFAAGVVASFSWVKEDIALSFPGVAITVSLVPPLAAIGISLALLSQKLLIGAVLLFSINLLGVLLASVTIFSLFGFARVQSYQDKKIKEEQADIKERGKSVTIN